MRGVMRALIARGLALITMLGLLALVVATSRIPCVPYGLWPTLQMHCRWNYELPRVRQTLAGSSATRTMWQPCPGFMFGSTTDQGGGKRRVANWGRGATATADRKVANCRSRPRFATL